MEGIEESNKEVLDPKLFHSFIVQPATHYSRCKRKSSDESKQKTSPQRACISEQRETENKINSTKIKIKPYAYSLIYTHMCIYIRGRQREGEGDRRVIRINYTRERHMCAIIFR